MLDISEKIETLRIAVAQTRVLAKRETIDRAVRGDTPKGDVLNVARAAACLAAKKTHELIPFCHPLPLDHVDVQFQSDPNPPGPPRISPPSIPPLKLRGGKGGDTNGGEGGFSTLGITTTVKTIGRTGVEMEALMAASIAALTIYDMLKGIDRDVVIGETRLIEKSGGKSDYEERFLEPIRAAVLVTSDSVSSGKKSDKSGKAIVDAMKNMPVEVRHYEVVPDDREVIRKKLLGWADDGIQLILTTGGTGLGPRDVTVEAVREIIEREVPGISEAIRSFGQRRTPYAMLSREIAGIRGKTLIVTLPGSSKGVQESIRAVFPNILHAFNMMNGGGHA